jgi:Sporulation and spore germination
MAGAAGVLAAAGCTLAACGIPTQLSASPISASQIRTPLPVTPTTVSPCAKSACTKVDVFFVAPTGRLAPVTRVAPPHPRITTVISALLAGPTASERATGFSTALGAGIKLLSDHQTTRRKLITLNFGIGFETLSGTQEVLGVGQVVYTVDAVNPSYGVIFETDGVAISVPEGTGRFVTGAVRVSEYAGIRTPTLPTTTTAPP